MRFAMGSTGFYGIRNLPRGALPLLSRNRDEIMENKTAERPDGSACPNVASAFAPTAHGSPICLQMRCIAAFMSLMMMPLCSIH